MKKTAQLNLLKNRLRYSFLVTNSFATATMSRLPSSFSYVLGNCLVFVVMCICLAVWQANYPHQHQYFPATKREQLMKLPLETFPSPLITNPCRARKRRLLSINTSVFRFLSFSAACSALCSSPTSLQHCRTTISASTASQ